MTEEQFKNFLYSCSSYANQAHFDHERYITNILSNKRLDERSFCEVIMENYRIANNLHFGVCFTMTCWAYHLLYTMGIKSDYYLLETVEKGTGFPNYVLLYQYHGEYLICDLAQQVQEIEEAHSMLFSLAKNPDYYKDRKEERLKETLDIIAGTTYLNQALDSYFKNYGPGRVVLATGINDTRIFTEIPKIFLIDFLKGKREDSIFR